MSTYDERCQWCGHPHHHGRPCPRTITTRRHKTPTTPTEAPCPCARHERDETYR